MDELPTEPGKAELLELIRRHHAEIEAVLQQLSIEQIDDAPEGDWSIKDHLAHLTAWERSMISLLRGSPRNEGLGVDAATYLGHDIDQVNREIYERNQHRTAADVLTQFQAAHQEMLSILDSITDEDLRRPYSHYLPDEPGQESGAPIVRWVAGNTYIHCAEHLAVIREIAGGQ